MGRLHDRVAEAVRNQGLWDAGDRVAVAVSGGLDSVVLLHVLLRTRGRHGGVLSAVTVDHGTRSDSASDADFVQELAQQAGLACHRATLCLGPGASEAACREGRYGVFQTLPVDRVALAHHRDDQAETVLLRLLRGAGTAGLAGMAPRRGRYVRPLLGLRRSDLERYAAEHALTWREDPTNASPRHLRNRVRHELLPLLEALRPGATATLARSATHAAEDEALLEHLSREQIPRHDGRLDRRALLRAPRALARRAVLGLSDELTAAHVDAILAAADRGTGSVHLSATVRVHIDEAAVFLAPVP